MIDLNFLIGKDLSIMLSNNKPQFGKLIKIENGFATIDPNVNNKTKYKYFHIPLSHIISVLEYH